MFLAQNLPKQIENPIVNFNLANLNPNLLMCGHAYPVMANSNGFVLQYQLTNHTEPATCPTLECL